MTKTQEGIFVECISRPETTVYNIPFLFKLSSAIDTDRLRKAVETALSAHPYVMSLLGTSDSGDVEAYRREYEPKVDVIRQDELDVKALVRPFSLLGGARSRMSSSSTSITLSATGRARP